MSRLSFRPRPLDIHKKLPIVKSFKEFEDDEALCTGASTRNAQLLRIAVEADNEVHQVPGKKNSQEIPTPQFSAAESYERDYAPTFKQPQSYLRGRGARSEVGEFVEYDLDNEDENWLEEFNHERKILTPEKFELILFKLETLDHKSRERAGVMTSTFGSPVPVLLQLDAAVEALQLLSVQYAALQSVYHYWKAKREQWQKPILRHLQPPPPANDTNPYNVFRPREKAPRLHTRRMQRRENNVHSFDKLRLVRRNLDQAKTMLEALIKREEKKREVMECEVNLQRIQLKYKHEAQLVEDGITLPGFQLASSSFDSSDEYANSDDTSGRTYAQRMPSDPWFADPKFMAVPTLRIKRNLKRRSLPNGWLDKKDPEESFLLFTRPLDPEKLAAAGIKQPLDPSVENGSAAPQYCFGGRIGRGGRIIFDRCNPLLRAPISVPGSLGLPPPNG